LKKSQKVVIKLAKTLKRVGGGEGEEEEGDL
jgi:hypothetical protein